VAGIEGLQQVKRFPAAHFAKRDAIWTQPQRGSQEISDSHRWKIWLLAPGL
jgi:hypothetical protein